MAWAYAAMAALQVVQAQGQAATIRTQADIQSQINRFNGELAEYDGWKAQNDAETAVARYQNSLDQAEGSARAMIYGRGESYGDSSLTDVVEDNRMVGVLNKMDISNQGFERAQGYKREVSSIQLNDAFSRIQSTASAQAASASGYLAAAGTGLDYVKNQQKMPTAKDKK